MELRVPADGVRHLGTGADGGPERTVRPGHRLFLERRGLPGAPGSVHREPPLALPELPERDWPPTTTFPSSAGSSLGASAGTVAPISPRYPLVELGTAVVFAAIALALPGPLALPSLLVVATGAIPAVAIDLDGLAIPGAVLGAMAFGAGRPW